MSHLDLVGRSRSHVPRTARIFALELGVEHGFRPVFDILALDSAAYCRQSRAQDADTAPSRRAAVRHVENICRELARRAHHQALPSSSVATSPIASIANAEELTLQAMLTEVSIIQAKLTETSAAPKLVPSLENSMRWLDDNLERLVAALPAERRLQLLWGYVVLSRDPLTLS